MNAKVEDNVVCSRFVMQNGAQSMIRDQTRCDSDEADNDTSLARIGH